MSNDGGRILTFSNIHAAISAERFIKARGFYLDLIPLPRSISSDCGFCLFISPGENDVCLNDVLKEMKKGADFEGSYRIHELNIPGKTRKEKTYERET